MALVSSSRHQSSTPSSFLRHAHHQHLFFHLRNAARRRPSCSFATTEILIHAPTTSTLLLCSGRQPADRNRRVDLQNKIFSAVSEMFPYRLWTKVRNDRLIHERLISQTRVVVHLDLHTETPAPYKGINAIDAPRLQTDSNHVRAETAPVE